MLIGNSKASVPPEAADTDADAGAPAAAAAGHDQTAADSAVVGHKVPSAEGADVRGDMLAIVKLEAPPLPAVKVASPEETATVSPLLPKASSPRSSRSASTTGVVNSEEFDTSSNSSGGGGSGAESGSIGGKDHLSNGKLVSAGSGSVVDVRSGGSSGAATSLPPGASTTRLCSGYLRERPLFVSPAHSSPMPTAHILRAEAFTVDVSSLAESAAQSSGPAAAPDTLQLLLPPPVDRRAEPPPPPLPLARQRSTALLLPAAGADPGDLAALPGLNDAQRLMFSAFAVCTLLNPSRPSRWSASVEVGSACTELAPCATWERGCPLGCVGWLRLL